MSKAIETLRSVLKSSGLLDEAEEVKPGMFRMKWGSATVMCTAQDSAVVAIAPIFPALPKDKEVFFQRLLSLNAHMGGTASFAVQDDESVVLQSGRGLEGLDGGELGLLLSTVGKFADDYDDTLHAEFYA